MSSRVIFRSDHEGLYQERPLYCPIYECRSFIPQARIDSRGVGTCIRCAAQSCCFCGKLGVHTNHLNCPVVIHMMEEQSSSDQEFAHLYRAMSRHGRWADMEGSVYGDGQAGATPPVPLSIGVGGGLARAAEAMIAQAAGNSGSLVSRLSLSANFFGAREGLDGDRAAAPICPPMPDPYRLHSARDIRPPPIIEIPTGASLPAPTRPASGSALGVRGEGSPAPAPVAPTEASPSPSPAPSAAANADHTHRGRSRPRLAESLRRQMPDQDQVEIQRNRQRFAMLRRVRQREYHRVVGSGFTYG
ncbi:hypothetical protein C7212DRAFT_363466 [Tuber magnatum]|uniref:Uncharacterized protein n=1 Tax=Tuber magnatum TaxID=42249 RepID=A0A317SR35_9PEZI|nr:hypothetical protein C7212DRAFT_363466 [Tuber magnatum]